VGKKYERMKEKRKGYIGGRLGGKMWLNFKEKGDGKE